MKIIGHRGAAGLATENTLEAIRTAIKLKVDAVEFDVWTTKDGVPILLHDSSLVRMTGEKAQVFDLTLEQIQSFRTHDGQKIPTAEEAIEAAGKTAIILEIKDQYLGDSIVDLLTKYQGRDISVTSFNHKILAELQEKPPDLRLFAASHFNQLAAIHFAKVHKFHGVNLNWRTFTVPAYIYARLNGLEILLFSVDRPAYARLLKKMNWRVNFISNYPDKIIPVIRG